MQTLYAFEKYVEDLLNGDNRDLKLREGDNFKHFEAVAANLKNHIKMVTLTVISKIIF